MPEPAPVEIGSRFQCEQCQSSFARKEHLTRHLKTHDEANLHTCSICGKSFNRSDSLLRHFNKHGQGPQASARSKRACLTCHAAKIKCDGEEPCQGCSKKKKECRYRLTQEALNEMITTRQESSLATAEQEPSLTTTTTSEDATRSVLSAIQVRKDTDASVLLPQVGIQRKRAYVEAYFTHFHHRFPIIHRVSHDDSGRGYVQPLLLYSIEMIGAWLDGSSEAREYARMRHQYLGAECILELAKVTSKDTFQQSLPSGICQAAMLNVAFVLYTGLERSISRGIMLHTMLIAALRETGFFNSAQIWPDQRPGYFVPMGIMKSGERQRLTQQLYRLDTYISMLRGSARMLSTDELIFSAPISFTCWNTTGLYDWEKQFRDLSFHRSQEPMMQIVKDLSLPNKCPGSGILIEDVQTSLCYIHWQITILQTHAQSRTYHIDDSALPEIMVIWSQLECVKERLDEITFGPVCAEGLRQHYRGFEEDSPGWQTVVEARVQTLWFDTTMLYHTIRLQLYVNTSRISQVVNEFALDIENLAPEQQQLVGTRRCNTSTWVLSPLGRRALCCAVDILSALQGLVVRPLIDQSRLDPISHTAAATAALIVWAHIHMGLYACINCAPEMSFEVDLNHEVDLSPSPCPRACPNTSISKEDWIGKMISTRVFLDNTEMCPCNIAKLLDKFRVYIPGDWDLAKAIAPGVFSADLLAIAAARMKQRDSYVH